jgi:hypothetical protein
MLSIDQVLEEFSAQFKSIHWVMTKIKACARMYHDNEHKNDDDGYQEQEHGQAEEQIHQSLFLQRDVSHRTRNISAIR